MASNVQAGTRGLSAGDWIRLQRLRGSRNFQADKDGDITNSTVRLEPITGRRVHTEFGTSKVRRPASFWTDYKASQTADYVLEAQNSETKIRSLDIQKVCGCNEERTVGMFSGPVDNTHLFLDGAVDPGLSIGAPIYMTGITVQGTIIRNNVILYVESVEFDGSQYYISFSPTPNGSPIDIAGDGGEPYNAQLHALPLTPSAIKHNGLCAKCIHS